MNNAERMVISAYEDGEVESPWKQQVEQRLVGDPQWSGEAQTIRSVKAALAADPEPDFSEASRRVSERLAAWAAPSRRGPPQARTLSWAWISVAAAALLLVASGTGFWLGRQSLSTGPATVAEIQVQVPKTLELHLSGEGQLLMASTLERSNP